MGSTSRSVEAEALRQDRLQEQSQPEFWSKVLLPPGRVVHLQPLKQRYSCLGAYRIDHDFQAVWVQPEDLMKEIILSPKMLEAHWPNLFVCALGEAADRLGVGRTITPDRSTAALEPLLLA